MRLEHGADEDIAKPVGAGVLFFCSFTEQGDNPADADFGCFFKEPFEAGGVLYEGNGDRDIFLWRWLGLDGFNADAAFLLMIVEYGGGQEGALAVG